MKASKNSYLVLSEHKSDTNDSSSLALPKTSQNQNDHLLLKDMSDSMISMTSYHSNDILNELEVDIEYNKRRRSTFLNQKEASIASSIFNLTNTIIGAGMLGLPEAISQTGYIIAAFLFVIIGFINLFTLNLNMTCNQRLTPFASYTTLCNATIPKLQILVDVSIAITCFGICCAYFVVIGDLLPDVIAQYVENEKNHNSDIIQLLEQRETWIIIYLFLFIIPTVRLRKMDSLRFTSFFAIICFFYIAIIVILYAMIDEIEVCPNNNNECKGKIESFPSGEYGILKIFKAAPIYILAYSCHFNSFSICNELHNNTMKRINIVSIWTVFICCTIYCIVGYFAYFSFGNESDSNILNKYPKHNSIFILRIGLSLAITFSYPVILHPCRSCLASLFFNQSDCTKLTIYKFWFLTSIIVIASFVVSMIAHNLGDILGIVGSTGANITVFILPGLFYYFMEDINHENEKYYKIKKNIGIIFVVIGIILIPFCVVMQFIEV